MISRIEVMKHACPACGATPDAACIGANGKKRWSLHVDRWTAAARAAVPAAPIKKARAPKAAKLDRATVRAMLDLFQPEYSDFWHNAPNDYGVITLDLHSGKGDPARFRGEEFRATYCTRDGGTEVRGTGRYRLNDKAVDRVLKLLKAQEKRK
jgi:hypothetical protein